jgi:hypothetical protein
MNPGSSVAQIPFGGVVGRGGSASTILGPFSGLASGMAVPVAVEPGAPIAIHRPTGFARTKTSKGELDATSRTVEVRVENSDASLMPPFRALPGVDVCISHFVNGDIFSG